jgi:uncharacterized protein (TIGR02145 family)
VIPQIDGVRIGDQIWSATNLDVATFRNGDPIPEAKTDEEWVKAGREGRPAWCYYKNDPRKGKVYGRMYNWYAVNDPRGLSPKGWHVPTNEEWIALENHLGVAHAGVKIKCDKGWKDSGHGNNSSGLCVLPGGYRGRTGLFTGEGEFIYLTSSSDGHVEGSAEPRMFVWGRGIQFENKDAMRCELDKEFGLYVRCVKDKPWSE